MDQLVKYLFIIGLLILVSSIVLWQTLTGVVLWRLGISFLVISIGVNILWIKK